MSNPGYPSWEAPQAPEPGSTPPYRPTQPGPTQYGSAQPEPSQYGQPAPPQYGGAQPGPSQYGQPAPTQYGSGQYGSPQHGGAQPAPPQYGSAQPGPSQYGQPAPPQYGGGQYGSPQHGGAQPAAPQYGGGQYGSPQYGSAPYQSQPLGGPTPPEKKGFLGNLLGMGKARIGGLIGGVVVLAIVVVIGYFTSRDNAQNAEVGDCLPASVAEDVEANPDSINVTDCSSADAAYRVVGTYQQTETEFTLDQNSCADYPTWENAVWIGEIGRTGTVLCLEPVTR